MEHLRLDVVQGVLTVTIDRPKKKNAFTVAMYEGLVESLRGADQDDAVRAVVVTGHPEVFTAGNDIGDFLDRPPHDDSHPVFQFLLTLTDFRKPLVAAVAGPAVGVGTTMLLHFDQVFAADNARFHLSFIQLGLVPEGGSSVLLPRLVGYQEAARLLMYGDPFSAEHAHRIGLVAEVVAPKAVLSRAHEAARKFTERPIGALIETKRILKAPFRDELVAALHREGDEFRKRLASPEAIAAFTAFMQKKSASAS